ncbi:tetratricopeptide repeat protein [Aureibacillus halotolerans]|uniref:Tetratricopeptide repeat protein n=1 Tax=Aureibacillus halotolerans TaxID=1508390 RepID=A0A4R6U9K9_9BACI|nr:tetratricopeptide repeat protein [Aureibacillus halotolerans]TDQ41519.1 tetratricopeptide repeat protein [Aureibacillus halotolerans]
MQIEDAVRLVEEGHVEEGLHKLQQIERGGSDDDLYHIASLYATWGQTSEAIRLYQQLQERYPTDEDLRLDLAEMYLEENEELEALELIETITEEDAAFTRSLLLLADVYAAQGLEEVAEQKLLQAKRLESQEPIIDMALGSFYLQHGSYKKAIPYLERVLKKQSEIPLSEVHLFLAEAYSLTGQFEEAFAHYQEGLQEHTTPEALFGLGLTALKVDEAQTAIHALQQLKEMDEDFVSLYKPLSEAYELEAAYDEAYAIAKEGIAKDSTQVELYLLAGRLAERQHEKESAIAYYEEALALDELSQPALKGLVKVYEQEEHDEPLIELLSGRILDSTDPELMYALANAYHRQEVFHKANELFTEAYEALKHHPAFVKDYVRFMIEEGKRTIALQALVDLKEHELFDEELEALYMDLNEEM